MMQVAEKAKSLACEQYGSRRNHTAIDLAVNKSLSYDLLRQLKHTGAVCSNDAKACYDFIGHTTASLAMQRMGVPKAAVDCLFSLLQTASHKVRTAFGDSETSYGGLDDSRLPMHRICQGNGAGPSIWAALSSPILTYMRSKGFGLKFISPIFSTQVRFSGYAFVDNTDLLQVISALQQYGFAISSLQQAIDTWEGGLKVTGRALVPEKTFMYLIDFEWKNGEWSYKYAKDCPGKVFANDIFENRTELQRVEPNIAEETLGILLAPDGALDPRQKKCDKWLQNGPLR